MLDKYQMLFSGLIFFLGSMIWIIHRNRDNPLSDDPVFFLPFNKLLQLSLTIILGFSLILVATARIVGER